MNEIVIVENLSKSFTSVHAVRNLTFGVQKGEVYGFLGQNGAGKSTTLRMLLGLIKPTAGSILIGGHPLHTHRSAVLRNLGAIIEKPDLYTYLTAAQNLQLFSRLSGVRLTAAAQTKLLHTVGLQERRASKVKTFSQGMKQRLGLACALVHNPQLLILDEPTNGLDPQGIADIRNLILHLSKEEGKTILLSSHLLSEIEVVADSMLIIDKGEKRAEGKVAQLLQSSGTVVTLETTNDTAAKNLIAASQWAAAVMPAGSLQLQMPKTEVPALIAWLVNNSVQLTGVQTQHSLEQYFLSLTTPNQHVAAYTH